MRKLNWFDYEGGTTVEDIERIERYFKIKLPEDYVKCALKYNGGTPDAFNIFDINGDSGSFQNLIDIRENSPHGDIIESYENIKDRLIGKIVPFGKESCGNLICFDYRNSTENPSVVFWDHERAFLNPAEGLTFICNTFSEFLDLLYEYKEED